MTNQIERGLIVYLQEKRTGRESLNAVHFSYIIQNLFRHWIRFNVNETFTDKKKLRKRKLTKFNNHLNILMKPYNGA